MKKKRTKINKAEPILETVSILEVVRNNGSCPAKFTEESILFPGQIGFLVRSASKDKPASREWWILPKMKMQFDSQDEADRAADYFGDESIHVREALNNRG